MHAFQQGRSFKQKTIVFFLVIGLALTTASCGSSQPCDSCGATPTRSYKNVYTGEKEYYCKNCSSDCAFCSEKATKHYASGLGRIVFVCNDCYEYIHRLND